MNLYIHNRHYDAMHPRPLNRRAGRKITFPSSPSIQNDVRTTQIFSYILGEEVARSIYLRALFSLFDAGWSHVNSLDSEGQYRRKHADKLG